MTVDPDLERGYRRWLRWYPAAYRQEHEEEILGVLMAGARAGQRRPGMMDCVDLMGNGLRMRLQPTMPKAHRSARMAVRLMVAVAVLEVGAAITILATLDDVRSSVFARNPGYTNAQWGVEVAGQFEPLIVVAGITAVFWLGLAWANGRGHRWAKIASALFCGLNGICLIKALVEGSAVYARVDVIAGGTLCLVQLAAVVLVFQNELSKLSGLRAVASRLGNRRRG